ncbi:hypothetical protein JW859_05605 [bacterium]|nr:hypothetical protein [bacterium]
MDTRQAVRLAAARKHARLRQMTFKQKLVIVLKHMFSKKALGYRAFTISWTFFAVALWNFIYFHKLAFSESLEVTATIVIGKFLFYGFWEYRHLDEINLKAVYDDEGPDMSQGEDEISL